MLVIYSKKIDYNTKISEIENKITADHDHDKYITTQEFNKFTSENFTAIVKQANLASKSDIANFVKKTDFDNKLKNFTSNKNELNELSKKIKAVSKEALTKDLINKLSILNGVKYFSFRIFLSFFKIFFFQNYLASILAKKYCSGTTQIKSWKSNGKAEENIETITKLDIDEYN